MIDNYSADMPVQNEVLVELKAVKSLDHIHNCAIFGLSEGNWLQGLFPHGFCHDEGANQTPEI
jgi:hypothetical protein